MDGMENLSNEQMIAMSTTYGEYFNFQEISTMMNTALLLDIFLFCVRFDHVFQEHGRVLRSLNSKFGTVISRNMYIKNPLG